jgi:S1-C subfamily serine protease
LTSVDWIIVALCAGLAVLGYRQGLIVGALTLAGFAGGAVLGARLAPPLLTEGSSSPYAPVTALIGAVLVGGVFAVVLESLARALRRRVLPFRRARFIDAAGGAAVLVALGLGIAWLLGAVALNTPGNDLRRDVQRSTILRELNGVLPPSGPILNVLNRVDLTPTLAGPAAGVQRPDSSVRGGAGVAAASASVVRVLGSACGLGIAGTGWVAGPGLVVTNAHVVAGQSDTRVELPDGASFMASAVHYEPRNDVAILRADGVDTPALSLASLVKSGAAGAVLGYPGNGDFTAAPARLGSTDRVSSEDSYGRGPVQRRLTAFRGRVVGGNSGGPLVDGNGQVMTTVFATLAESGPPSGLGVPNGIVREALQGISGPVETGPCVAG